MPAAHSLPPSRGLMAVDAEAFSRNPSSKMPDLSAAIPELIGNSFSACGFPKVWRTRRFPEGTGDGYFFGVAHEHTPFLIHPLLHTLQAKLEEYNRLLMTDDRELRLRLRVAVHMGAVPDQGDVRDGIGTPTNDTFRLLNSLPAQQALKTSNPDITLLAAIVSQRVFEDVIRAGHIDGLHPDHFEPVTAEVPEKGFAQPAWLYLPKPSRRNVATPQGPADPDATPPHSPPFSTTIRGSVVNSISGGNITGKVQQKGGRPQ